MNKQKLKQIIKVTMRCIPAIPILVLLLMVYFAFVFKRVWLFILHGGEFIIYEKDEKLTIKDLYDKLKTENNE